MKCRSAFTLIELLVSVGIVAALTAMLLPALGRAEAAARLTRCSSNLHQLSVAFAAYASANRGRYPPNTTRPAPAVSWYDAPRIGLYLPPTRTSPTDARVGGGVYVCPDDTWGDVRVSYAMNVWAGAALDDSLLAQSPASGRRWSAAVQHASQMLLLAEAYAGTGSAAAGYAAGPTVGQSYATVGAPTYAAAAVTTAGQRFGGAGGVLYTAGRYGKAISELCFSRHRLSPAGRVPPTMPRGRLNVAYADGHVALRSDGDLVTAAGVATGDTYWTPADTNGY